MYFCSSDLRGGLFLGIRPWQWIVELEDFHFGAGEFGPCVEVLLFIRFGEGFLSFQGCG